ncbi:MAG: hypothetical protein ACYTFM_08145 [Planctomycetota bacterium]|jgi:hypothetical protein
MKRLIFVLFCISIFVCGCESLRFAPSQEQKANAWLHNRTAVAAAQKARQEMASRKLQQLTELSKLQSRSFVSYFGLPKELPAGDSTEEILSQSSWQLAETSLSQSGERPDVWELTDSALELGIAVAALLSGVYGTRAVSFLKNARKKSKALKEIVEGNELFKKNCPEQVSAFKDSQKNQTASTRQIVAAVKSSV